jgi:beta-phosphoglucomutase
VSTPIQRRRRFSAQQSVVRGVVFDMDGVIVDSHPAHRCAWKLFLESVGRFVTDQELEFILDGRKREEILRYFLGDLSSREILEYGMRKDEMLRRLGLEIQPIEGVIEFLTTLSEAGINAALATSAGRSRTEGTLSKLGITDFFVAIVTGDEVYNGKPDPTIYRIAAQRLGEHPKHLVAIEDAVSGVQAARLAGLRCLGIAKAPRAAKLQGAGAQAVVPDFRSLQISDLCLGFT